MNLIGKQVGNYRVTRQVGEGGMGAVYLGEHPMIGKKVAIKVLHGELATKPDIVARFFTEAKAVNDIGHPNIVDIVDFGTLKDDENKDVVYFIMEYLDGEGLGDRLKGAGLTEPEAVHVMRQCASALAASHKKHVVHRDLKPDNIYLIRRGGDPSYVKLLDFGIAKLTGDDPTDSRNKTRTGLVIGTPSYMSPEQCEGRGRVDWRSDVYSLGVVFYELLTGRLPFVGAGFGEILVAHLTQQPEAPSLVRPGVSPEMEAICLHLLEKKRDDRLQSMEDLIVALDDPAAHLAAWGPRYGLVAGEDGGVAPAAAPLVGTDGSGARSVTGQGGRSPTGQGARVPTGSGPRPGTGQGVARTPPTGSELAPRAAGTGSGLRATTLSGSAVEMAEATSAPGPKSRAGLFAVLGAVGALALGGASFALLKRPSGDPAPAGAVAGAVAGTGAATGAGKEIPSAKVEPVPSATSAARTRVTVDSTPEGASIYRAGHPEPVGKTPFTFEVLPGDGDFDVVLKLDGFRDEVRTIAGGRDHDVLVPLAHVEGSPPAPAGGRHHGHKPHDVNSVLSPD